MRERKSKTSKATGFSDLARQIGMSEMTIVNWEKERAKPIKQNFERLEKILGDFPSS